MNNFLNDISINPFFSLGTIGILLFFLLALTAPLSRLSWSKALTRLGCGTLFLMLLLNPQIDQYDKKFIKDTILLATDRSPSMNVNGRAEFATLTQQKLYNNFTQKGFDVRSIDVGTHKEDKTEIFSEIEKEAAQIPIKQSAGIILISDGQIMDLPSFNTKLYGPLNLVVAGSREEFDSKIVIDKAPSYSLSGQNAQIKFHIQNEGDSDDSLRDVAIYAPDKPPVLKTARAGETISLDLKISPGKNQILINLTPLKNEISPDNNQALVSIEGIRNKLRVVLVSGAPYPGVRMWRDLLKSDPGIDLIHFTILRGPRQVDATPTHDLSLIAFPVDELFNQKLHQFDLVIMDRFSINQALPPFYLSNIKDYVLNGGALIVTTPPDYNQQQSIFYTPLAEILPLTPSGPAIQGPFKPQLTASGTGNPITSGLAEQPWGNWLQFMPTEKTRGETLLTALNSQPLLVIARADKGRVAQLASDQIWLWAKHYDGGGPATPLLKKLIYWVMKDPSLDERAIHVKSENSNVTISKHANEEGREVRLTGPDGISKTILLTDIKNNIAETVLNNLNHGIYKVEDQNSATIFEIGSVSTPEQIDLVATDHFLKPLVQKSHGSVIWAKDHMDENKIQIRRNHNFQRTSLSLKDLIHPLVALLAISGLLFFCWFREGRSNGSKAV